MGNIAKMMMMIDDGDDDDDDDDDDDAMNECNGINERNEMNEMDERMHEWVTVNHMNGHECLQGSKNKQWNTESNEWHEAT